MLLRDSEPVSVWLEVTQTERDRERERERENKRKVKAHYYSLVRVGVIDSI